MLSKNMDFLVKHWAPFPRRFPSSFPVINFDYIHRKENWVTRSFNACNFSLILRGRGEFRRKGKTWEVCAPCVITQWPGEFLEYGPSLPETWDELYVSYPASSMGRFRQCGFVDPQRPVWPIADAGLLHPQIAELEELSQTSTPEAAVDRVDRVCERLVLETLLLPQGTAEDEQAIHAVLAEVKRNLWKPVNFETVAARAGMSPSTFRRRWAEVLKTSPGRYLQQLRMREACRLLVETEQPIYQIAHEIGFEDELYFSRRFQKAHRMAPRDYRHAYRLRPPER